MTSDVIKLIEKGEHYEKKMFYKRTQSSVHVRRSYRCLTNGDSICIERSDDVMQTTPQGYTYLPVEHHHMLNWGGLGVCDDCNQNMQHGYLVFILNRCICSRCLNEWIDRAKIYPEDLAFQEANQQQWYDWHIQHGHMTDIK